ncbi:MAG TPA: substrate-binding domain-containing protein [Tepidisphaeraceae bacterium]|jgi:tungstate transport system substrate-binding protein|nr:substrate-binding domain-containing protein [Tepidisphaeraceae bacterium]
MRCFFLIAILLAIPLTAGAGAPVVRVAAIGGINDLNFWSALSIRFEQSTGIHIDTVATGNKDAIPALFQKGGIDLLTMQSSDVILSLVANGYAADPQPWMQTDLAIIGPATDPAHIKGMTDASAAVKKILHSQSPFVIHASSGADQIVRAILQGSKADLDSKNITVLLDDHQKRVLQVAVDKKAYTLIARIPYLSGKIKADGFSLMVTGDPILRRPLLLAIANPQKLPGVHLLEAQRLATFLFSEETQKWIAQFGKSKFDDQPFYFSLQPPH